MQDSARRSLVKAISWRFVATLTTALIVYGFTREFKLAAEIGVLDVIAKLILYFSHERLWGWIPWGRSHHPLEKIPLNSDVSPEHLKLIQQKLEELGYR